jgi:hypothetical protein
MNFVSDFTALLKIQLLSKYALEIESDGDGVHIIIPDSLSYQKMIQEIKQETIVCYNRLIFRRNQGEMDRPITINVKNGSHSTTIKLPDVSNV